MGDRKILVVEDDADVRQLIVLYLRRHGLDTAEAGDGREALEAFEREKPDLLLLDIMIPHISGWEVCRRVREASKVPILFLSSKWESKDVVAGLEIGGDDYIVKPFVPDVLVARVKANLRRIEPPSPEQAGRPLSFGSLRVDPVRCEVWLDGCPIDLLAKEMKLLLFMARHPRQVFSAEQLYEHVWDPLGGDPRTVMVHISRLRRKLEKPGSRVPRIRTVKGIGYKFEME